MLYVSGRFNGHLRDVVILFCDEALWGGDRAMEGTLKGLITDDFLAIESKGVDLQRVRNYKRVIVATNNAWAVPRDLDDRRFLVLDIDDTVKEDAAYFGALHRQMTREGGAEALLFDLLNEPLDGFNPRQAPRRSNGFDLKIRSLSPVLGWWFECLWSGINMPNRSGGGDEQAPPGWWDETPTIDALHRDFVRWCEVHGKKIKESRMILGRELRKIVPHLRNYRPQGVRRYVVGPLEDCRKAFEIHSKSGREIWEEDETESVYSEEF
jgi:hypothetical protein